VSVCYYPCPYVYCGDPERDVPTNIVRTNSVRSSLGMVQRRCTTWFYHGRISGLLMDRFDIHIEVPRVDYEKLTSDRLVPQAAQRADPAARGL
jgi:predicted ATPase with chaperone activity